MATDFSYGGKQIVSGGPLKPNGKDMPSDARTRVDCYADIATIPNPYVGLKITVKVDETNNNKMTDYIVKSLKANSIGLANSLIDEVEKYVDYLGVSGGSSGGGSAEGLTTEQTQQLQTAYEHSQTAHVQASDIPSLEGYATETFVTNKIAEASLSGGEVDLSGYATKEELNSKANVADIPTKVSDLENDSNFISNIPAEYITETELNAKGYLTSVPSEYVTETELYEAIADISVGSGVASIIEYADDDTFSISNSTTQTIVILTDQSSMTFMETGGGDALGVKLSGQPSSDITVNLSIKNGYCQSNKTSLTFTSSNYDTYQYFTLTGVEDTSSYSDKTDILTLSATGIASKTINVTIINTTEEPTPEEPTKTLSSISATYTQGSTAVYPSSSLDSLKSNLVVTANYSDSTTSTVTDYALSGSLTVGTSIITVTYQGKTTTFNVNVSEESSSESTMLLYLDGEGNADELYGGGYALETPASPFTWLDKSGNGYDATLTFTNPATWVKTSLQGGNGYAPFASLGLACSSLTSIPISQNFTLDISFKTPSKGNEAILTINTKTLNAADNGGFSVGYSSDNKVITRWNYEKPFIGDSVTTATGTDVRVTIIKNGKAISLYKDGTLISTDDTKAGTLNSPCTIYFYKIDYKYIKIWNEVKNISDI